jgi:hypothetical protein
LKNSSQNISCGTVLHTYLQFLDRRLVQINSWMSKCCRMLSMTLPGKSLIRSMLSVQLAFLLDRVIGELQIQAN